MIEPGKKISVWKFHQITGYTGEHLLRPTTKYMKIEITGKLPPCEIYSILHTANQLKLSIKELSWGTEDDALTLDSQETAQQQLVHITNLEKDLQNHGTEMNEEEGPKDKSLQQKRPVERPSRIYLDHSS